VTHPDPRSVALRALVAVEAGERANVALAGVLGSSRLPDRDRALVTELTYGTVRMQRACDWLAEPYVHRRLDPPVRSAVRMGVHQLAHLRIPAHAAVSATVAVAPARARGLVNAVLRRVAERLDTGPVAWPDDATRLSYPQWILEQLSADLGHDTALAALDAMNRVQVPVRRPDGFVQGLASQWVAEEVDPGGGGMVLDLCAAPGGKATALAGRSGMVVAADRDRDRVALLAATVARLALAGPLAVVAADATDPPFAPASADAVVVDAPCSGLGALARRPDARWRARPADVDRLAGLQRRILAAAAPLVRPGGQLVYAVCTTTGAETTAVDRWFTAAHAAFEPESLGAAVWRPWGSGGLVLPQDHGSDGMAVFRYRRSGA
jgi:16S rRNA (cytosine967-C5)-methyltransferase